MNSISTPFLGLSLQGDQFCLVRVEGDSIQAIATRELIQPFDMETFREGGKLLNSYVEIVRDLYQRVGGRGTDVGVALNSNLVFTKRIPVALGLDEEMIKEHLTWEVEQFLIGSIKEYIFDYQRLPFQTSEGNPFFLSILVRKKIIEGIGNLVKMCELSLKDVDVDIFASVRALLANFDLDSSGTSVLVDIQRDGLAFVFIRQREFFLSHRIPYNKDKSVSRSIDNSAIVQLLMKELKRLVFGHNLGRGVEDLDGIYFIGNEAVRHVYQELSDTVKIPMEIVNPFLRTKASDSVTQSQDFSSFPERFVPSIGITLKHMMVDKEKDVPN